MKAFTISSNDAGQRVDRFLSKACPRLPQGLMYKYIRKKRVKLNAKRCEISTILTAGDLLELYISDELLEFEPQTDFHFVKGEFDIIYEDDNLLLINKPIGLVVHEDNENTVDTLINRIKRYLSDKGEWDPNKESSFAPALCNRLDRNTGGIVIAAKTASALRILNQKIKDREIKKLYLCVLSGKLDKKSATLTAYIEKDSTQNLVRVSDTKTRNNLSAITRYLVIDENEKTSLVEVDLITGRTHQIRAHFAYIGHPLLGDGKYGNNRINKLCSYKKQALFAYRLTFEFTTFAGELSYLTGKSFEVKDVWLRDKYYADKLE